VQQILGQPNVEQLLTLVRERIEPHEDHFCYYLQKTIRGYTQKANSGQEGTNHGMKDCAAPVLLTQSFDHASVVLTQQGRTRQHGLGIEAAREATGRKNWSALPTSKKLNRKGELLVSAQWKERDHYICVRVVPSVFYVKRRDDRLPESKGPLPMFHRVRKVKIIDGLICSCCHFEQNGIVCCHCMAVLIFVDPDYKGVLPSDICVAWWADFELIAYRTKGLTAEQLEYANTLEILRENDVTGPCIDVLNLPCVPISCVEEIPAGLMLTDYLPDYCRNYSSERLHVILQNQYSDHVAVGLLQDIFVGDDDDDSINYCCDDEPCVGHPIRFYELTMPRIKDIANLCEEVGSTQAQLDQFNRVQKELDTFARLFRAKGPIPNPKADFCMAVGASTKRRKTTHALLLVPT
jgi:hypothetical protein